MNDVGKTLRYGPGRAARRARLAPLVGWLALGLLMGLAACTAGPATPAPAPTLPPPPTVQPRPTRMATAAPPTPAPSMAIRSTPSPTPRVTPGASPTATANATPSGVIAPILTITGHLYCRTGPGIYYPAVTVLHPNDRVQVAGANKIFYDWWYVLLPDDTTCWVHRGWTQGVSDEAAALLPQVPAPPPPPAAFKPIRHQWPLMLPFCPVFFGPALQFQVKNLGPEPIRSFEVTLTVLDTGAVYRTRVTEGIPTCGKIRTQLPPRETVAVVARTRQDLTDHRVRLALRGCTQPNFQGACVAYNLTWTIEPPPRPRGLPLPWP